MSKIEGRGRTPCVLWRPQILGFALAAVLVTGACSGDDDPSTVERADTTSTAAETTTTLAATTTTVAPCPEPAAGDGSADDGADDEAPGDVGSAEADVDGDGEPDRLMSRRTSDEAWRLVVELARGGGAALELATFGGPIGVVGGADVDGDGDDEIWARTGAGASTTIVGLFSFEACELTQVGFESGGPVELPVGGSVGTTSGVECDPEGGLLTHTATYTGDGSDDRYSVETTAYRLDGDVLVAGGHTTREVAATDADFVRYTSFGCGGLSL